MNLPDLPLARSLVDRAAEHRLDEAWLAAAWDGPSARVVVVSQGRALWRETAQGDAVPAFAAPADAPDGERYFLGVDSGGTAYFAVAAADLEAPEGVSAGDLRALGSRVGDRDAGLLVHAIGLEHWHRTHRFCSRCGVESVAAAAGHVRRCPSCGAEHFPRTDPAVIMLVVDNEDRALLARNASWPEKRLSTLAGFVEPGESLEQAVAREVLEEVGVVTDSTSYLGSQPWPFPSSLMLGFTARTSDPRVRVDHDEIAEARWFTRAQLKDAMESGDVIVPGRISIARALVEHWYGERIDDDRPL